jgi:hypothetical protein
MKPYSLVDTFQISKMDLTPTFQTLLCLIPDETNKRTETYTSFQFFTAIFDQTMTLIRARATCSGKTLRRFGGNVLISILRTTEVFQTHVDVRGKGVEMHLLRRMASPLTSTNSVTTKMRQYVPPKRRNIQPLHKQKPKIRPTVDKTEPQKCEKL